MLGNSPNSLKEIGNKFFLDGNYKEAINCYTQAIELLSKKERDKLSAIFANRSNCHLHLSELEKALEDADKAISFNRIWWKPYLRKANVLYKMNDLSKALEQLEMALSLDPENNELKEIQKKFFEENEKAVDKIKIFNPSNLMETKNIKEVQIENFHDEYQEKYPNEKTHHHMLKEIYHDVKNINLNEFIILNMDSGSYINKEYLIFRFGVVGADLDKFVKGRDFGDIIKAKNDFKGNFLEKDKTNASYSSFSLIPPFLEYLLKYGKNYAIISPVDLNIILNFQTIGDFKDGAINIFDYEACPLSCSKSLIIHDMLRRKVNPFFIIQVWYSSGWSTQTENEFLISCENVLKITNENDLKLILEKWLKSDPLPLEETRDQWLREMNLKNHMFYNFKEKRDRIEVIRYLFTGELLICNVGSRTMFINPLSNYSRCMDENFIHSINLMLVEFTDSSTFLTCILSHLVKNIKTAQEYLEQNKVKIIINYKEIVPKEEESLKTLKSHKFWIVYWNNLCDFYSRENFHKMAKLISYSETIHVVTSLYWFQEVYGTEIYDLHSSSRRVMMDRVNLAAEKSNEIVKQKTLSKKILEKPIASLQNRYLYTAKVMFKEKWADFYFECLNRSNQCAFLTYFGLTFMQTGIYLTFSYNNGIKLRDASDFHERI